jgi:hypothetical protein
MSETSYPQLASRDSVIGPAINKVKPDCVVLTYMAHQLSHTLQQSDVAASPATTVVPLFSSLQDCQKRTHRIAIYQPQELLVPQCLSFVGFVSGKQAAASSSVCNEIERIDELMVAELVSVPGMFSYSSLEVRPGRWYNLVVFASAETKTHLKKSHIHSYAVHQLAPRYYAWIRLHNGIMPTGLAQQELLVQSTKYYTFQEGKRHPDMYEITYGLQ